MSIASTQQSMGYVCFTRAPNTCDACSKSRRDDRSRRPHESGLRCTEGGFWVGPSATCNRFSNSSPAHASDRVQIGPTDV